MKFCYLCRLLVLIVQSLWLSHSFTPKLIKPRFHQTSSSRHVREPLAWFQGHVDKIINRDRSFESYQPIESSSQQSQSKQTNIFSKIFHVLRKNIAILSIVFLLPTASFARSSSSKKSSGEISKPTNELVKVLKKKGGKATVVIEKKSQKSKQPQVSEVSDEDNDEEIFQQRLKYIGIGLTAASILATLLSGDDTSSSSKSKKSKSPSRDNNNTNNNNRSVPTTTTPYKSSGVTSTPSTSSTIKKTMLPKRPISSSSKDVSVTPPITRKAVVVTNNEEDDDDLFSDADIDSIKPLPPITPSSSSSSTTTPSSTRARTPISRISRTPLSSNSNKSEPDVTDNTPPVAPVTPVVASPPPSPPMPTTPVTPAPPAKKQGGGGILSRIFQKPGGNRDPSLTQVLKTQDSATEFRMITANLLAQLTSSPLFPELNIDGGRMYDPRVEAVAAARAAVLASPPIVINIPTATDTTDASSDSATATATAASPTSSTEDHTNDAAGELLEYIAKESNLSSSQAAEAFAEVTSAMLVTLIDEAVILYEQKEKEKDKNKSQLYDENILEALDIVTDFVAKAGDLYAKNYVSIAIDPVQYNGKSKKNSVEGLYLLYFKSSASWQMKQVFDSIKEQQLLQQQQEESAAAVNAGTTTTTTTTTTTDNESTTEPIKEKEPSAEEIRESQRVDKTSLLIRALGIKEGKRNSLEQKVQKEIMMNMSGTTGLPGGDGGGGGLGDMFQALKGGGAGGMPDMSAINNMMGGGGGGGGFPGGMPGMGGGADGENPFKDMSQEEMMEMTKQSITELKNMLAEGNVTKDMVIEMEKGMGIDFNAFVKMMDLPGAKENLKKAGPEMLEMMVMFKQLVQIKKNG